MLPLEVLGGVWCGLLPSARKWPSPPSLRARPCIHISPFDEDSSHIALEPPY